MKKIFYVLGAAICGLSLAACSNSKCDGNGVCQTKGCELNDMVYTGVLPAADTDGIRYTLNLDYDKGNMKGDYDLIETYIQSDTTSATGYSDKVSFRSEGDFIVENKDGNKYLRLVKDARDSSASAVSNLNFLVESDSTIVLVNADLQKSETPGLNYTLKLVK